MMAVASALGIALVSAVVAVAAFALLLIRGIISLFYTTTDED